jgi:hypothetical protein
MTDNNSRQDNLNQRDLENDKLDRQLEAALARYAAVEPRAGLEDRILANLRAEKECMAERSGWRWQTIAALAAVIVVILLMAWRSGKPARNIAKQRPPATTQVNGNDGTHLANNSGSGSNQPHEAGPGRHPKPRALTRPATIVVAAPKLDQFPSPQPLSEQEAILTRYVANYPEHAALIAQARSDELRRDSAEEMDEAASAGSENSQQRNK